MKSKLLLSCVFVILLGSCNHTNQEIKNSSIRWDETLQGQHISAVDTGCYGDLTIKNGILLSLTLCEKSFFYGYNTNQSQAPIAFGSPGPGPEEYDLPLFMGNLNDSVFQVFDVNRLCMRDYSVKNNGQIHLVASHKLPLFLRGSQDTFITQDSILYGNTVLGNGLLYKYSMNINKQPVWFNLPVYDNLKENIRQYAVSNKFWIHEKRHRLAIAMRFYNVIHIFDMDGSLQKTISFGRKTEPEINYKLEMVDSDHSVSCFTDIYGTDDRIFALWEGGKRQEKKNSILFELDWEGNLIHTFRLDREITCIAIDQTNRKVYGVAIGYEDMRYVVVYSLENIDE